MIVNSPSYRDLLTRACSSSPAFDRTHTTVFVHLPKTAGSSLSHFLIGVFDSPFHIPSDDIDGRLTELLDGDPGQYDLVYGHLRWRQIERLREHPASFRLMTFVRDPIERAISHYRYFRSPNHHSHERFRRRFPTLDAFMERHKELWSEFMAAELVGGARSVDEFIAKAESLYCFVGATEEYDLSLYLLCSAFGLPFQPCRVRVNTAAERPTDDTIVSEAHRDALAEGSRVDRGFHRHILGAYRNRAPELFARYARDTEFAML